MKILVTGGTGFLGQSVVRRLVAAGAMVRVLVRPSGERWGTDLAGLELMRGDLCDPLSLQRAVKGMEAVCHCAAHVAVGGQWSAFHAVTVLGTERLLEVACQEKVRRFLHVSSLGVHALNDQETITEESPFDANPGQRGHYAHSKIEAERLVWKYSQEHDLPVTVIRPGVLYGPARPPRAARILVPFGPKLQIAIARPEQRISLAYVDNVADAIHLALVSQRAIGRVYNVVDETIRQGEYLALLQQAGLGQARTIVLSPKPFSVVLSLLEGFCRWLRIPPAVSRHQFERTLASVCYDTSRAREELGWSPQVGLGEALRHIREAKKQPGIPDILRPVSPGADCP